MDVFEGVEFDVYPQHVKDWEQAVKDAGWFCRYPPQMDDAHAFYKTPEQQELLGACKSYAEAHTGTDPLEAPNVIFVVHPYYAELMNDPSPAVYTFRTSTPDIDHYIDIDPVRYKEIKEMDEKQPIGEKGTYRLSDEERDTVRDRYEANLERLLTSIDRDQYDVVLVEIAEHFAAPGSKSRDLVDRGLIDRVVFTKYSEGEPLPDERQAFSSKATNFLISGAYADACTKAAFQALPNAGGYDPIGSMQKLVITDAIVPKHYPSKDVVDDAYSPKDHGRVTVERLLAHQNEYTEQKVTTGMNHSWDDEWSGFDPTWRVREKVEEELSSRFHPSYDKRERQLPEEGELTLVLGIQDTSGKYTCTTFEPKATLTYDHGRLLYDGKELDEEITFQDLAPGETIPEAQLRGDFQATRSYLDADGREFDLQHGRYLLPEESTTGTR